MTLRNKKKGWQKIFPQFPGKLRCNVSIGKRCCGKNKSKEPIFKWLTDSKKKTVGMDMHRIGISVKYLIDEQGKLTHYFPSHFTAE